MQEIITPTSSANIEHKTLWNWMVLSVKRTNNWSKLKRLHHCQ